MPIRLILSQVDWLFLSFELFSLNTIKNEKYQLLAKGEIISSDSISYGAVNFKSSGTIMNFSIKRRTNTIKRIFFLTCSQSDYLTKNTNRDKTNSGA